MWLGTQLRPPQAWAEGKVRVLRAEPGLVEEEGLSGTVGAMAWKGLGVGQPSLLLYPNRAGVGTQCWQVHIHCGVTL